MSTESREVKPSEAVARMLQARAAEFVKALPKHISFEKFQRTIMTAILLNPDLLNADRTSLFTAAMRAAGDGLLPDGRDGAFVVFNNKKKTTQKDDRGKDIWQTIKTIQFMPMFVGLLKKVRNTGELSAISARCVYANDFFEYELGDDEKIIHKPTLGERGAMIAFYAIARLKDGSVMREVMTMEDIERVKKTSKSAFDFNGEPAKDSPWTKWPEEMGKKSVFRRLSKWLPQSIEIDAVFEQDQTMQIIDESGVVDSTAETIEEKPALQIENNPSMTVDDLGFNTERPAALQAIVQDSPAFDENLFPGDQPSKKH